MHGNLITVAASAALAFALALAPSPAEAGAFYRCKRKGGGVVLTNRKIPGARCRVAMRWTDDSTRAAKGSTRERRSPRPALGRRHLPGGTSQASISRRTAARAHGVLAIVEEAAARYQLPVAFVLGVIHVESRFKTRAVSRVGAMGLMQLMPAAAASMGVRDPWDPYQNVMGGCRLLRKLADRFDGDYVKVMSGYHAGGAAVARKGGIPYEATDGYVRKVLDAYYGYLDHTLELPAE